MSTGGGGTTGPRAPSVADTPNGGQSAADLSDLTWAFCSRPRNSSDDSSATRRWQESQILQVFADRFSRGIVELAQAVGTQGLVARVDGGGVTPMVAYPLVEVEKTVVGSSTDRERPHLRRICRGKQTKKI